MCCYKSPTATRSCSTEPRRELHGLEDRETQFDQRVLPCTELLSAQAFYKWRDGFDDWARSKSPDLFETYRSVWQHRWTEAVTEFQTFEAPLVELPVVDEADNESIGHVCAIFEKLNSTGVELSVYDLLTARLYRSGIRLHELWNEAVATHPRFHAWSKGKADWHKFGVLVLRTLALLRGLDPKPRILIDLEAKDFETDWRRATAAIERALELATLVGPDGFGVFAEKWLPGYTLIPILAALRAEIDERRLGDQERAELRRWYWCNVFMERYSSAVESKSRKDYQEMTNHWLNGAPEPDVFRDAQALIGAPGFRIRGSASFASAVYSGVFCLLAIRNARDWMRGEDIRLQDLQDHHIFPQSYLRKHGFTKRVDINTIANRTLISDETNNNRIKAKAPADYLVDPTVFPSGATPELLEPHFIDEATLPLLLAATDDLDNQSVARLYERFLRAREATMIKEIRRVCGIAEITEGEVAEEAADEVAEDIAAGEGDFDDEDEFEVLEVDPPLTSRSVDDDWLLGDVRPERRELLRAFLRAVESLGCQAERPHGSRQDYINVHPAVNYGTTRLFSINRSTARIQFEAGSYSIAESNGLGSKVDHLSGGDKAALDLETAEDVSTAVALTKAVLSSRRGLG